MFEFFFDNLYNVFFFVSGYDFLFDGLVLFCIVYGDVWQVEGILLVDGFEVERVELEDVLFQVIWC